MEMGWGRGISGGDPGANWTTTNDMDFAVACKEGYRRFLYPDPIQGDNKSHNWSFLYPLGTLQLSAGYSAANGGDVDLDASTDTDGVVVVTATNSEGTLSASSWPTWAKGQNLIVDGEWLKVTKRAIVGLDAVLTLANAHSDQDTTPPAPTYSTDSWSLPHTYYDLPDDFGGMVSDSFTYRRDEQWNLPQIRIVGEVEIRKVDRANTGDVYPRFASITPVTPVAVSDGVTGISTRWRANFYPLAERTYEVEYRYYAIPPALDETTNIYPYGGAEHSETIIAAVIDALYRRVRSSNEKSEEFYNRLRQSILHDRRNYQTNNHGRTVNQDYVYGKSALSDFRSSTPSTNVTTTFNT